MGMTWRTDGDVVVHGIVDKAEGISQCLTVPPRVFTRPRYVESLVPAGVCAVIRQVTGCRAEGVDAEVTVTGDVSVGTGVAIDADQDWRRVDR
jgi:hypothetical protein